MDLLVVDVLPEFKAIPCLRAVDNALRTDGAFGVARSTRKMLPAEESARQSKIPFEGLDRHPAFDHEIPKVIDANSELPTDRPLAS